MTRFEIWIRSMLRRLGVTRLLRSHQRLRSWWHRRAYRRLQPDRLDIQLDGWRAVMLVGSAAEYAMLRSKQEDYALMRLLGERIGRGDCYWDIGSSLGFYAVLAARMVGESGQVLAFEPEPRSRDRLQQNVAANGLTNVSVLPMALGRERGTFRLAVESAFTAGSHQVVSSGDSRVAPGRSLVDVHVVTGDELRATSNPPLAIPDVVKIDVEGAELDVIAGLDRTLRDPRCRTVLCEVHFTLLEARGLREGPLQVEHALRERGFAALRWVDRSHLLACR